MESDLAAYVAQERERRKTDQRPTVMFAMPHYGIAIHRLVYESHLAAVAHANNGGNVMRYASVTVTNKMSLAAAENQIVRAALETEPTYVFWTEQDMILPNHTISHLISEAEEKKLDIISGVYFLRGNGQPCLYKKMLESKQFEYAHSPMLTFPENALFEVGCPGMGCVLIKTEVFRKICGENDPKGFIWFDDQEGKCGTDMYFYTHARRNGFKVWADSRLLCGQIDEDEPRLWTIDDYPKWREEQSKLGGFLNADRQFENQN